jgi:hypothetical protein
VALQLVASCRWNCGLGKLSTILEMKILRRQLYMQLPRIPTLVAASDTQLTLSTPKGQAAAHQKKILSGPVLAALSREISCVMWIGLMGVGMYFPPFCPVCTGSVG